MAIDGIDHLGRIESDAWRSFLPSRYDLQVCSFFATGVYDERRHDARWLDSLLEISRMIPDTSIVKATFRQLGYLAPHRDLPGFNYLWVHSGTGFIFEGEVVATEAGDVLRFARDREHGIVDTGTPFYRTNIVAQDTQSEIEFWNSAFPTTCWLRDGRVYDWDGEREIPWHAGSTHSAVAE